MSKAYWCIILAAIGWLTLAGAQQPREDIEERQIRDQQNVASHSYRPHPNLSQDDCYRSEDHDAADLCAQWRAAIAAERSAKQAERAVNWSIVGTVLSALALVSLLVTLGQTRKANRISEKLVDATNRPFLVIEPIAYEFFDKDSPVYRKIHYRIKNIGGSPAIFRTFHSRLEYRDVTTLGTMKYMGGSNPWIIDKGSSIERVVILRENKDPTPDVIEKTFLFWNVNIDYVDLFYGRRHFFFEQSYFPDPIHRFTSNDPPRVVEVPYDLHKWHRRRNKFRMLWVPIYCAIRDRFTDAYKEQSEEAKPAADQEAPE